MPDVQTPLSATAALAARLGRNATADAELRAAVNVLGALLKDLPSTDDMLLTDHATVAWRTLRDRDPSTYLLYRGAVRQRCGRHVTDILDAHIGPPVTGPDRDIRLLTVEELLAQPAPRWLVDGRLPERGLAVMYGESQSGKTFLALDVALAVATGRPWFGRDTNPGGVIYVAAEGRLRDRVSAYTQQHGLETSALCCLRVIEGGLDLTGNTRDLERMADAVTAAADELGKVGLVVLDTLARVMAGSDENSGRDMGAFIAAAKRVEDACGGLVLAIHHCGKNVMAGARGHSSLRAATDAEIEVTRDESGIRSARVTKLRDAEDGETFSFRLAAAHGSCIVVPTDERPRLKERERRLGSDETIALDTLKDEIAATGFVLPATTDLPGGKRGARVENWRVRFYSRLGEARDISSDGTRKAFQRGLKGLVSRKVIGVSGLHAWIW